MNLSAVSRRLFRSLARPLRSSGARAAVEPLEARIAPASLASATQVTFLDSNGDIATVTISKPLFTAANINKVFTFDTGSVDGTLSTRQLLETIDIDILGYAATGLNISITAANPVDVGYINASGLHLGTVNVVGDLGRIHAGNFVYATPAIQSLTVDSLGAQGGNIASLISGYVPSITVNGDIDQASIGLGGGAFGHIGSLTVTGSVYGGPADFSGSIRTQGGIGSVQVDGSIFGGGGASSGVIGTAGPIGSVVVEGSVVGGGGTFSGAILATGAIGKVRINGDITGGTGVDSGQIGTASTLGPVIVESSVQGGGGQLSGVILSSGGIKSVSIANGLVGGGGASSGQIGTGGNIGSVTIGSVGLPIPAVGPLPLDGTFQGIENGVGVGSGTVLAHGTIGSVTIGGDINGSFSATEGDGIKPAAAGPPADGGLAAGYGGDAGGGVISAGGGITAVTISGGVYNGAILSGGSIGTVTIVGPLAQGSEIHAHLNIGSVSVNASGPTAALAPQVPAPAPFTPGAGEGIDGSAIFADTGSIGSILAGGGGFAAISSGSIFAAGSIGSIQVQGISLYADGIDYTQMIAGSLGGLTVSSADGIPIYASSFVTVNGMGPIAAYSPGTGDGAPSYGILDASFRAGGSIASITATCYSVDSNAAIFSSGFDAGGNIGAINAAGDIFESVFIAGINLGPGFGINGAGTFNNSSAANFGFGAGTSHAAATIGNITLTEGTPGNAFIEASTFLAGVHGPGPDHTFGTTDDLVPAGSGIGTITAPDGFSNDFFESGVIGATTGAATRTIFVATG